MKLRASEKIRIREFVLGVFSGINVTCNGKSTISEVLGEDYWITWSDELYVNLVEDDDGDFQCAVFPRKPDGQIDMSEWQAIKLYEETSYVFS
jgi:hypothetical protein